MLNYFLDFIIIFFEYPFHKKELRKQFTFYGENNA